MNGGKPMRVVIAGGGYSAVAFVCQWLAAIRMRGGSLAAFTIVMVEPRDSLGAGVAYSTSDVDHRVNAPAIGHIALASNPPDFQDWFLANGGLEQDPDARRGEALFPRRRVFAEYLAQRIRPYQLCGLVRHWRDSVDFVQIADSQGSLTVRLSGGVHLQADLFVIATGHLPVPAPAFVTAAAQTSPAWVQQPWQPDLLRTIEHNARVLLIGTGLTAADVMATLARHGHRGMVRSVSRRGLRPQRLPPPPDNGIAPAPILERLRQPVPQFLRDTGGPTTVRGLLRALRARIAQDAAAGRGWYDAFDDLRDALHRLWPELSAADQRRFQRHLKPWYDTYRYRMPPQTAEIIMHAEDEGRFSPMAARVLRVDKDGQPGLLVTLQPRGSEHVSIERFDRVINCTGPGQQPALSPLFRTLLDHGLARVHPSGMGLDVDRYASLVDNRGVANPGIRVIGPPATGAFGDSIGAVFICAHIERLVGDLVQRSQPSAPVATREANSADHGPGTTAS